MSAIRTSNPPAAGAPTAGPPINRTTVNLRSVRSGDLLGACREVLIEHAGVHYCLRVTSNNKLILTK